MAPGSCGSSALLSALSHLAVRVLKLCRQVVVSSWRPALPVAAGCPFALDDLLALTLSDTNAVTFLSCGHTPGGWKQHRCSPLRPRSSEAWNQFLRAYAELRTELWCLRRLQGGPGVRPQGPSSSPWALAGAWGWSSQQSADPSIPDPCPGASHLGPSQSVLEQILRCLRLRSTSRRPGSQRAGTSVLCWGQEQLLLCPPPFVGVCSGWQGCSVI